jgi:beta-glucanase (GH16 family)
MKINLHLIFAVILQAAILISCKDHGNSETPQFLFSEQAIPAAEDDPDGIISVPVYLSAECDKTVSVDYVTVDSTAIAGSDYVSVTSGNLTFQPGELAKEIKLNILSDSAVKKDVYFNIQFSNPVNSRLSRSRITIKIINVDFANLAWADEFNLFALNTAIWNYEQGAGGWGNNELQKYTNLNDNVHIDTGYLYISALNPSVTSYTSGRINTLGKKQFTYGRIDIRAKLPEGQGLWPALWMLGLNYITIGWPKCGEIDIMELLGHEPAIAHGAVHWDSNGHTSRTNSFTLNSGKFSSGFHIFSLIWTPNKLIWMVDKQQFFYITRAEIPAFPFDLPQFFIFNVAVGGNWPGPPDQTTVFPQHMIVDYIRVYQ